MNNKRAFIGSRLAHTKFDRPKRSGDFVVVMPPVLICGLNLDIVARRTWAIPAVVSAINTLVHFALLKFEVGLALGGLCQPRGAVWGKSAPSLWGLEDVIDASESDFAHDVTLPVDGDDVSNAHGNSTFVPGVNECVVRATLVNVGFVVQTVEQVVYVSEFKNFEWGGVLDFTRLAGSVLVYAESRVGDDNVIGCAFDYFVDALI